MEITIGDITPLIEVGQAITLKCQFTRTDLNITRVAEFENFDYLNASDYRMAKYKAATIKMIKVENDRLVIVI